MAALLALALAATSNAQSSSQAAPWSYADQSAWADITGSTCGTGKDQSPVAIVDGFQVVSEPAQPLSKGASENVVAMGDVEWQYKWPTVPVQLGTTPRGWQAQMKAPYDTTTIITFFKQSYALKRIEFTSPSENQLNGKSFDMEMQYVHQASNGVTLVQSVFLEVGLVQDNEYLQTLWKQAPTGDSPEVQISNPFSAGLPSDRSLYAFNGSQTIPPCGGNVIWVVYKEPIVISRDQRDAYRKALNSTAQAETFLRYSSTAPTGVVQPWDIALGMNNRLKQPQGSRQIVYFPMANAPPPPSTGYGQGSLWGYLGIALLALAVLVGVLALVCLCCSNKRRGRARGQEDDDDDDERPLNRKQQGYQQIQMQQGDFRGQQGFSGQQSFPQQGHPQGPGQSAFTQQQMQNVRLPPTQQLNFSGPRPPVTQFNLNR